MARSLIAGLTLIQLCGCIQVLGTGVDAGTGADPAVPVEAAGDAGPGGDAALVRPPTGLSYAGPQGADPADAGAAHADLAGGDGGVPAALPDAGARAGGAGGMAGSTAAPAPTAARPNTAGQVVLTEIMANPAALRDDEGEWIELYNPSASQGFDLGGCTLDDGGGTPRPIPAPLRLAPGAYVTLARSDAVGFRPNGVLSFSLGNGSDAVALGCDGVEIDRVAYDGSFPLVSGASMSLDPAATDALANDMAGAWCAARVSYGGDLGTPGEANPACDPVAAEDGGVD